MNNNELLMLFKEIDKNDNCFDRAIALKKAKKQYRKSDFYKQMHYPITWAYKLYRSRNLDILCEIANNKVFADLLKGDFSSLQIELENMVDNFDYTVVENFIKYLSEKLTNIVQENELLDTDLGNKIKELKELVIK